MISYKKKPYTEAQVRTILNPLVEKWFFNRFKSFSLPQLYGVMEIHSRNNVLISAPTGATKTLTAFLAILNELVDNSQKGILEDKIYCVYVSPLKALNYDIAVNLIEPLKEIEALSEDYLKIRVGVRTGDTTQKERTQMLKKPPHILVTTPESLAILLSSPKFIEHLKDVQYFIADEIHALAENKRGVHLNISMERLGVLSSHMARIGLSATISPIEEIAKYLVGYSDKKERDCQIIDVQFIKHMDLKVLSPVKNLIESSYYSMHDSMYKLIDSLIHTHITTLIFTNTRAATEKVVDYLKEKFPKRYSIENIGAHHGSLSKEHRHEIESNLRKGKLKSVACSTSLELGIDIGYIDLVLLLGSPKSVARAVQRCGRAGHKFHQTAKGRIIVLDRDDLIECSILLKNAVEKKIDRIHIPRNSLDVLAQQINGIILQEQIHINDLYKLIKSCYCYHTLSRKDFSNVVQYLCGDFTSLEDRHVYAKIWYDKETGMMGKRGRLNRVIYMTNIGTIPDASFVRVKIGEKLIGTIDEGFLEKLKPGDVFVLGGNTYRFKFSRGMTAQVAASVSRPPTVPRWVSESLPLSFDLALDIGKFRRLIEEKFKAKQTKKEIIDFINGYVYVDENSANAIYEYCKSQFDYVELPSDRKILIEHYHDGDRILHVFHTLFGRRVNDCLSRAIAYAISIDQHADVEIGISDNGFYLTSDKNLNVLKAFELLKSSELRKVLEKAIDKTEVFKRRFRHCAGRALMILRNYKGKKKNVGMQQVSAQILICAVKRISPDFFLLKETRREILEDLMDVENAKLILERIENKDIEIKEVETKVPSPFAFNLVVQGKSDIMKIDDKIEFLKRMHEYVRAKISLNVKNKT